jgi:molybdate transport system substrate-binding protein
LVAPGGFVLNRCRLVKALSFAAALALSAVVAFAAQGPALTVFAAASLKDALDEQVRQFEGETNTPVVVSYAGSNVLAKQIESGAPADLFISADLDWMDYLDGRKLLAPGSRHDLLGNRLVLIAPATATSALKIAPSFGLAAALGPNRLALANPDSVPAGKYAKEALQSLGVWEGVEKQVARTENVRAALALVARGEAPFGIVYATDARAEKNVRVVDVFPPATHAPIVYPIAIVAGSKSPAVRAFVDFLDSALARGTWERFGFNVAR